MAFLILLFVILLCGLLSNIRLDYNLTVERERAALSVRVSLFWMLIRFRVQGSLTFFPLRFYAGGKMIAPRKGQQKKVNKRPLIRELIQHRILWLRADHLKIRGAVGNAEDACAAVYLAGAIFIVLDCLARFVINPASLLIRVVPICGVRCFCLNLEGIVTFRVWQIIGVAIRHQIRGIRGRKLWRIPLKTS